MSALEEDSPEEELSGAQMAELAEALAALHKQLRQAIEQADDGTVELDQTRTGRVSRIDALQQQQMTAAGKRGLALRLQQVRAAQERISREEYGDCLSCEEPIGIKRLRARPEAPFCLACQGQRER